MRITACFGAESCRSRRVSCRNARVQLLGQGGESGEVFKNEWVLRVAGCSDGADGADGTVRTGHQGGESGEVFKNEWVLQVVGCSDCADGTPDGTVRTGHSQRRPSRLGL